MTATKRVTKPVARKTVAKAARKVARKTPGKIVRVPSRRTQIIDTTAHDGGLAAEMVEALRKLAEGRAALKDLADAVEDMQVEAIKVMKSNGYKPNDKKRTVSITTEDGRPLTATLVQNSTLVTNEAQLKKRLGAPKFAKLTRQVLDKRKLNAAIASGEVNTDIVADCSTENLSAAYVKTTVT